LRERLIALTFREGAGEAIGTYVLVLFGVGAVHSAVLTGAQAGLWQVAIVWALAVALALYTVGGVCDAHLNPAITIAMVVYRRFSPIKACAYLAAQLIGAMVAALTLYGLFGGALEAYEASNGLVRGGPGSERSAMVYGDYFPNPSLAKANGWTATVVSLPTAASAEAIGTAFLAFVVFSLTDERNRARPHPRAIPMIIGEVAIPGPRGGFFVVYIAAPIVGALIGAGLQRLLVDPKGDSNG
jgi:glycerol uptake facilitator protein